MVNDPFGKWDRVVTFCTLLVDLGRYNLVLEGDHKMGFWKIKLVEKRASRGNMTLSWMQAEL